MSNRGKRQVKKCLYWHQLARPRPISAAINDRSGDWLQTFEAQEKSLHCGLLGIFTL
jgi:hypothetical protein